MKQKNIYLVQAGEKFSVNNKTAYLPYAIGTIAAKAWSNGYIQNAYCLRRIIFLREPANQVLASLQNPFLVGFSCYLWNYEYSKSVAKKIKDKFPSCLIVFGGHNVPSDTSLLEECSFIDIIIHGEGEEIFEKLLTSLNNGSNLSNIPNISYRTDGMTPVQTARQPVTGSDYPSPYTTGIFDQIIKENAGIKFSAILETNRGCPNNCAFCDWGPLKTKVRMFPMERVKGDIDWFSENNIEYIWGADANFGQFERDTQIAAWMIEAKMRNGYPVRIKVNYAKYNNRNVFELAKRFSEADLSKSTTVSFQTLSDVALKNIGRSNMTMKHFSELITLYRSAGIPTYSEMILALPGETYESFTSGIGMLLDSGQHSVIEIYDCELLKNSTLADKNYLSRYKIKTVHVPFVLYHCEATEEEAVEYSDIVISTESMAPEDWVRCKLFSIAVQCMQCLGLLRFVSIYIHNEKRINYSDFYIQLIEWYLNHPETLGSEVFEDINKVLKMMPSGENYQYYYNKQFGDVRWYLDEGAFFRFISNLDRFYTEINAFLSSYMIDKDVLEQLLIYQKNTICVPGNKDFRFSQDYDFYNYMLNSLNNNYIPLDKVKNTITFIPYADFTDLSDYAREIVWYGRRLGRTIYTSDPKCVKVEYYRE